MNLRQIEILRAVMRRRTTVGAASELGMSQPAVSNAIKHMESQLGCALFDRIAGRLVPTREAEMLFEESDLLFAVYEGFRRRTQDIGAGNAGRLTILATAELSESLVPKALACFSRRHSNVQIEIEVATLDGLLDAIDSGLGDIGFAMSPLSRSGLDFEVIHEMEMVLVCPADDDLAALPVVSPEDLRDRPLIVAPRVGHIHAMVQRAFEEAGVPFRSRIEARFQNVALHCVKQGLGVAVLDSLTAQALLPEGLVLRPFRPALPLNVYSITASHRPISRLASRYVSAARDVLAAVPGSLPVPGAEAPEEAGGGV
ncbi:LysR family transcriptional regulator [Pseudoroseicyclus sp. CXY001]|uniref:LysR family transcriptional regulator n=1 Tax=Pseudoroseicyclus sp. CXY001 TaxID=3242492 RepID=UPI003570CF7D